MAEPSATPDKAALIRALSEYLDDNQIIHDEEALRPYECDGLSAYRQIPLLVVLPENAGQVQAVMRCCHAARVPVVARGAATGLSGGALPLANGVLLSLAKLKRIVDIDPLARTARVQPGVRNLAISEAAAEHNLYYAPDPSSQIACTIGGNVAENAGGVHCLKYGLTVHNVLQIKVVTVEGELLTLGGESLDAPGYDLLALMIGSEGMLGVVVEVLVKLLPTPQRAQVVLAAFDDVSKAANAVGDVIAAGIIPAGLEMMDGLAIRAAEDFAHAGYPTEAQAILLCELDGTDEEVSAELAVVRQRLLDSAPSRCVPHAMKPSAPCSGKGASRPSRRWAASRPTTTAWMAPCRASGWPRCCWRPAGFRKNMNCRWPMCSMRVTAICTR